MSELVSVERGLLRDLLDAVVHGVASSTVIFRLEKLTNAALAQANGPAVGMDWISFAIRDLCELPDRNSPEDFPEGIVVTADEIREAIIYHMPSPAAEIGRTLIDAATPTAPTDAGEGTPECAFEAGEVDADDMVVSVMDYNAALRQVEELKRERDGWESDHSHVASALTALQRTMDEAKGEGK